MAELLERVNQLEQIVRALKPSLHVPSTATLEQRVRWLEMVMAELAKDNGLKALEELLGHSIIITGNEITFPDSTTQASAGLGGGTAMAWSLLSL
jgi:hypothetical protein